MNQLAIDLAPRHPARQGDPISSHQAAHEVVRSGLAEHQAGEVLEALCRFPWTTSRELAEYSGLDRYMAGRRLPELKEAGLVDRDDGMKRKCRVAGRIACTWWPTEKGRTRVTEAR